MIESRGTHLTTEEFLVESNPRIINEIGVSTLQPLKEIEDFDENYLVLLQNLTSPICTEIFLKMLEDELRSSVDSKIIQEMNVLGQAGESKEELKNLEKIRVFTEELKIS